MTRFRNGMMILLCVALVAVLTGVGLLARRAAVSREQKAQVLRGRWRAQNAEALMAMSAVGRLSVNEQAAFDRAGDDPERMRQVLIGVHEDRLANASKDLADAQQRKVELQGGGGYKVYADEAQPQDLVELANEDEWTATSAVAQYAGALQKIRAWQPESFEAFVANGGGAVAVAGPPPPSPAPVPVTPLKPDPRVPSSTATRISPPRRGASPLAASAVPPGRDREEVAAPVPEPGPATDEPVGRNAPMDATAQVRAEAQIRETLRRWAGAMTLNDPQAESAEYAAHMSRYFLRTNVDRAFVEADKAAYLRRGNRTASFEVRDVAIENETDTTAEVRLVKDVVWGQSSSGATHKLIRSELWMVRTGDGWKIAGERDFR